MHSINLTNAQQSLRMGNHLEKFFKFLLNRNFKLQIVLILMIFIAGLDAYAQETDTKPILKFKRIYEGLISNRVSAVFQDKQEYMWMGTLSGLHRYDGLQFQVYATSEDSTSINDNYIGSIFQDKHNELWIGTGNGMARYNKESDDFTRYILTTDTLIQSGYGNMITSILEDSKGVLWVSSPRSGIFYFDREQEKFIPNKAYGNNKINDIAAGEGNILWLATAESGIGKLNIETGKIEYIRHNPSDPNSLSSNKVEEVITDADGNLWAGIRGSGLNRMVEDNGKIKFIHYRHEPNNPNSLFNNEIYTLYTDHNGRLWVGNENGGLHLYNKKDDSFHRYLHDSMDPFSLTHNSIWSVFQDSQGRLWVGTAHSGINLADPYGSKFDHYYNNPMTNFSLNNDVVRDFLEDDNGNIWIATDGGGLNFLDREKGIFKFFMNNPNNPRTLESDAVVSLNKDPEGRLWVGTWGGGVSILEDENRGIFTSFGKMINKPQFEFRNVFDVHFEDKYTWLAAMNEGIYRYSKSSGEMKLINNNPDDPNSLSANSPLMLVEDSDLNFWIATLTGLNFIASGEKDKDKLHVKRYLHDANDPKSLSGNSIRQIFEDSKKNIWVATDNGLSMHVKESDKFINYYQSDGLPVNEINSIVEDDSGVLWIGTVNGISRFDPLDKTFKNYYQSDGLQGNEFSRYSVLKTSKGELLFGGLNGFNIFHPEKLESNPYAPPIYITELRLFNRPISLKDPDSPLTKHISVTDTLTLSYKQSVISLEFIALNYTRPDQNEYAYILEGFEEEWNYVGTQRNATYTNLDPGQYVFRVKAANNDGLWYESGSSLVLIITPPFYKTIWFYVLSILLIGAILITIYWLRIKSIHAYNKQLEQTVDERTNELKKHIKEKDKLLSIIGHDLRNPFISIIGYMEMLEDEFESEKNSDHLENIQYLLNVSRNTQYLLENLLQWASNKTKVLEIRPQISDMEQLVDTAFSMVSSQASFKKISLEKSFCGDVKAFADQNMILTVLRNLISNAIKFSQQNSKIKVSVVEENGTVITSVSDNGTGMDEEILKNLFSESNFQKAGTMGESGTGLGLVLCHELIRKHDGNIWTKSTPGKGSTFYFSLPKTEPVPLLD